MAGPSLAKDDEAEAAETKHYHIQKARQIQTRSTVPVQKVRVEELADKVEGVALYVDKGQEELDDVFGWELDKFHLQVVLQQIPEPEPVERVVVELAKHSGKTISYLSLMLHIKLRYSCQQIAHRKVRLVKK